MVHQTQPIQPEQKYVTDGHHVYHYNEHLAELVARDQLKYCERPLFPPARKKGPPVVPNEPIMEVVQSDLAGGVKDHEDDDARV